MKIDLFPNSYEFFENLAKGLLSEMNLSNMEHEHVPFRPDSVQ